MKVIFVLVDALKTLYLNNDNMPFLTKLGQQSLYVKRIVPCPGFCERSEVFTGLDMYDSGNFCAIGYNPEYSEYAEKKMILSASKYAAVVSEKWTRYAFSKWNAHNSVCMKPYRIPYKSLCNFSLTEDGNHRFVEYSDIFDSLHLSHKTFTKKFFTTLRDKHSVEVGDLASAVKEEIKKGTDFIPVYIGETDSIGHKFGDDIWSIKPCLRKTDTTIKQLYELAISNEYGFVVLGDHGMVPVIERVDILSILKKTSLKHLKDYELFLDSTMARLWFYNKKAKTIVKKLFQEELGALGLLLCEDCAKEYQVPLDIYNSYDKKSIYGDLLWCANTGVLISPDYFNSGKKEINGMHGYLLNDSPHSTGQLIVCDFGKQRYVDSMKLQGVCKILCEMLEIDEPNNNGWIRRKKRG